MDSIWTMINDEMGKYMEKVIKKYKSNIFELSDVSKIKSSEMFGRIINQTDEKISFKYITR